jgi:hypothetical protein
LSPHCRRLRIGNTHSLLHSVPSLHFLLPRPPAQNEPGVVLLSLLFKTANIQLLVQTGFYYPVTSTARTVNGSKRTITPFGRRLALLFSFCQLILVRTLSSAMSKPGCVNVHLQRPRPFLFTVAQPRPMTAQQLCRRASRLPPIACGDRYHDLRDRKWFPSANHNTLVRLS